MKKELSDAIHRFNLINKSKSQLADWNLIRKALSGSGQNSTAAFEKWWDTGVHGWGNEKLAEYKLAKDAWLAALSCGETNKQSTPCKKMISCGLLYDSELCDNGFRECYE